MTQNQKDIFKRILQVIVIILLLITIWYIGKDWLRPKVIKALGGYTAMEHRETIDTLNTKYDSIYFKFDSLNSEVFILNDVNFKKDNTIKYYKELNLNNRKRLNDIIIHHNGKDFIKIDSTFANTSDYDLDVTDSLIKGHIRTSINLNDCSVIAQSLNYIPLFPKIITKTVTVEKTIQNILSDKPKGYIGIGITSTSDNSVGGVILYQTSNKWQFQAGYNKYLSTSPAIPTKGNVQLGIIKLF